MPLNIKKPTAPKTTTKSAPAAAPEDDGDEDDGESAPASKPAAKSAAKPAPAAPASKGGLSFIKRGADAQAQLNREEQKAELRRKGNLGRFYLPINATSRVTFLDGNLTPDGVLDAPFFHEHNLNLNGSWRNWFICTQDEEPCPICEGGSSPYYAAALTVIDHSEYTDKNGVVHKDEKRLFVAKRDTIKKLQKIASKRGGLRGCTFEISRVGDKSANTGSDYEFETKLTEAQLQAKYPGDKGKPVDYDAYLTGIYQSASDLRKLGFGASSAPVGSEKGADYQM